MQPNASSTGDQTQSFPVNFVADAHLIQILGEQLIGSEKVGVLELVKNAYDAGASTCHVWIEKVPGLPEAELSDPQIAELPGPVITVIDDGCGMNKDTMVDGWMRPATRIKTSVKERLKRERAEADRRGTRSEYEALVTMLRKQYGGRLPLGEKGVGRFATHRLGRHLILQTKTKDEANEWYLLIPWDDFDSPDNEPLDLEKVGLTLISRPPQRDYGPTGSGTMLRVYGPREGFEWTEEKLRDIGYAIAHLLPPIKGKKRSGFDVAFHCPQLSGERFEPLTETVPAPFECVAIVDEKGKAEIEVRFVPPPSLLVPLPPQTWSLKLDLRKHPPEVPEASVDTNYWLMPEDKTRLRLPECGPFTLDVKCWIRTGEWIDSPDTKEFTEYLDKFGGIGVCRDGLSILPAQTASRNDWLWLAKRHIKKGRRISYYQMAGSVDLLQEHTLGLVDRTSREGLIETRPFKDLSVLAYAIISELERYVQETRERHELLKRGERIPATRLKAQAKTAANILDTISSQYQFEADSLGIRKLIGKTDDPKAEVSALSKAVRELPKEFDDLRTQTDALLEAAGYGIAIGVAVHEIEKVTSNLYFGLDRLSDKLSPLDRGMHNEVFGLSQTAGALLNELKRIAPLRVTRLEKPTRFKVRDCILAAKGAFQLSWEDLKITFIGPPKPDDFEMEGSFGACSQVFANLFDNATYWLKTSAAQDRNIMVQMVPAERKVVVADSGPGIDERMRPHLFELFHSLKNPPSGLGLYICKYYMQQMKGTIRESSDREKLPTFSGAHFTIVFPKEKHER